MAFEGVDIDGNGTIDMDELKETLKDIAKEMKIQVPTENDCLAVLYELD